MTFTYKFQAGPSYYSEYTDEDFYDIDFYDYEVDYKKVQHALAEIFWEDYFKKNTPIQDKLVIIKSLETLVSDLNLDDSDDYYDQLKDYFEDDASRKYYDRG